MGVSTDGEICFGFRLEEGVELPWEDDDVDEGIDGWWRSVNGYHNPNFNPFTKDGNYKRGVAEDDPRVDAWFDHETQWNAVNPMPIAMVNCCSRDCPEWIIAVPSSCISASRGNPESFDPARLTVASEQVAALRAFCEKHGIETTGDPQWWLSSYYG